MMSVFLRKSGRFNDAGVSYLWQAGLKQQAMLSEWRPHWAGLKQKVCPGCLKAHATDSIDKGATSGADQEP